MRAFHKPSAAPVQSREGVVFTGGIWGEVLAPRDGGATLTGITFARGARTLWHRHEGGQMLIGEAGAGLVVSRSGEVAVIGAGVAVHACPDEEHWHGAFPDSFMTHLARPLSGATVWRAAATREDPLAAAAPPPRGAAHTSPN